MAKKFLPFEEARDYVRKLGLKGIKEWNEFTKSDKFPNFLPKRPEGTYKDEWQGATDWVGGTHTKYLTKENLLPFEEAREYVRKLGLKKQKNWLEYCASGKKPLNIPSAPFASYKMEWKGYPDWLGIKRIKGGKAREYGEAREYVRKLGLSNKAEWIKFTKSDKFPLDIPRNPDHTYRGKFQGFDDWLNCKTQSKFLSYEDAGKLLNEIGINSSTKFAKLCTSGKRPKNIPSSPEKTYKKDWQGWNHFLGKGKSDQRGLKKEFLPFDEARKYVRKLNIEGSKEWRKYCTSGKKPENIPSLPDITYRATWEGLSDWLGTGRKSKMRKDAFLPFEEARDIVRKLGLTSRVEWMKFIESNKLPKNIPKHPDRLYQEFSGFADWLGCELSFGVKTNFLPFEEARDIVRKLGLTSKAKFEKWRNETKPNIPAQPHTSYKEEWKGWPYFLDVPNTSGKAISANFLPFEEARDIVRKLGLKDQKEWLRWAQTKRPKNIPSSPYLTYKEQWINLADWLGTKRTRSTTFLPFEQSREYARGLKISSIAEWESLCSAGKIPHNIPNSPEITFKNEWVNWYDWLGHDDPNWSVSNVKELLRELIKSKIIYQKRIVGLSWN